MNQEYLIGRGAIVRIRDGGGEGCKIDGWVHQVGNGLVTIDSVEPVDQDIYNAINAVDDFHVLYRFGKDFGQINVSGTIYLGCIHSGSSSNNNVIQAVQNAFNKLRLSSQAKPVKVSSAGGGKWNVAFVKLSLQGGEAEFQRIKYTLTGLIIPSESS